MSPQNWHSVCVAICLMARSSAVFADSAVITAPAVTQSADASTPAVTAVAPPLAVTIRGKSATVNAVNVSTTSAQAPRDSFQQRLQQQQQLQRQAELDAARRPTEWQLQNPSGQQNRTDESQFHVNGYVSPNTYYGARQRPWSNLSAPVYERAQPPNIRPVPPLTQTRVMVAPYTYWGPQNTRWNMVGPTQATPSPLGGWNMGLGW